MLTRFHIEGFRGQWFRWIALPIIVAGIGVTSLRGEIVPLVTEDADLQMRRSDSVRWVLDAAGDALSMGYATVAGRLYLELLAGDSLDAEERGQVLLGAVSALISTGEYARSEELLATYPNKGRSDFQLRAALTKYYLGSWEAAQSALELISEDALGDSDRAWYFLLAGLLQEAQRNFEGAEAYFESARETSVSEAQRAQFEVVLFRLRLLSGLPNEVDESLAADLRTRLEASRGQAVGFQHAKVYAVVLNALGRREEAMAVVEEQLQYKAVGEGDLADQFLLLLGIIAGEGTARGKQAFHELLSREGDRELQRIALQLLVRDVPEGGQGEGIAAFLNDLIDRPTVHPLLDELYYFRAYLSLSSGRLAAAEADAKRLLDQFPGSTLADRAIHLLAFLAWQHDPPHYRNAADYLYRLRERFPSGSERARLSVLMADCFYLNGDYGDAAEAYDAALMEAGPGGDRGAVLFQLIMSFLESRRLDAAVLRLDEEDSSSTIDQLYRWRIEWNLINKLKESGRIEAAFERVRGLLAASRSEPGGAELRLRLLWLEAQLSIEARQPEGTPERADYILDVLSQVPEEAMGPDQRDLITSHTILLKGQAYFELKRPEEGLAVFEELRARFPESDPAVLSHLIEARYYAAVNNLVLAQQRLRRLTDTYPESRYAPLALWEAALFAAYRDDLSSDSGALKLLEELVTSYPSHELVYFARLKQADHLRSKIEFGAAQLIYEDLINNYPQHPERYRAELSRADCHFAQAGQNASRLGDAIAIFQRLVDLPHLPVDLRVESGFKWGNAEAKSQGRGRAQDVFMLILNRFLRDSEMASQLGVQGRYWMARMIFKFGELLEEEALYEDALSVYSMIETYGLPGEALLKNKLRDLSVPR